MLINVITWSIGTVDLHRKFGNAMLQSSSHFFLQTFSSSQLNNCKKTYSYCLLAAVYYIGELLMINNDDFLSKMICGKYIFLSILLMMFFFWKSAIGIWLKTFELYHTLYITQWMKNIYLLTSCENVNNMLSVFANQPVNSFFRPGVRSSVTLWMGRGQQISTENHLSQFSTPNTPHR